MIKDQFRKIKDNWLLVLLIVVLLLVPSFLGNITQLPGAMGRVVYDTVYDNTAEKMLYAPSMVGSTYSSYAPESYAPDFAPEIEDRKIVKTTNLGVEVEHGAYQTAEQKLLSIVSTTDTILLNRNVNTYDFGSRASSTGNYGIKVDIKKYDAVIVQLKEIGTVISFDEGANDVTGSYKDLNIELDAEKARLERYKAMLTEAETVQEKLDLIDRIFSQERTIKYLEDSLKNINQQVVYATLYVQITEKPSAYANVVFVTFGELIQELVSSISNVVEFIFIILPYALVGIIIWLVIRLVKKRI